MSREQKGMLQEPENDMTTFMWGTYLSHLPDAAGGDTSLTPLLGFDGRFFHEPGKGSVTVIDPVLISRLAFA